MADKIKEKFPQIPSDPALLTFQELALLGAKALRLVATDLVSKRAVFFGTGSERTDVSVVDAVRDSASLPLLLIQ